MTALTSAENTWGVPSVDVLTMVENYLRDVAVQTHDRLGTVIGVALTTAVAGGDPLTTGASTAQAAEIDLTQYAIGLGPCLQVLHGGGEQYVADLEHDLRWGAYGPAAAALGARSCLSVPVTDGEPLVLGVLKVYSGVVDGLGADQRQLTRDAALAIAGGLGVAGALVSTSFELADRVEAMDTRRTIDLATGVLMGRLGLSAEDAFATLRHQSQNSNVKLHEVAAALLSSTADGGAATPRPSTVRAPFSRRGDAPVPGH